MINVNAQLVEELTNELSETIEYYLNARKRNPDYAKRAEGVDLLEGLEELIEELDKHGGIHTEHNLTLTAEQYWEDMIRAKIKLIGMVGGFDLVREVYDALEDKGARKQAVYNTFADGVSGWMV